jgi:quinol monooxygenase YgiN
MIFVAGRLYLRPGTREQFLALSADAMMQARRAPGCRDFVVAADPMELDRVNVYEAWTSRAALAAFRGTGPGDDLSALIVRAEVAEHVVTPVGASATARG